MSGIEVMGVTLEGHWDHKPGDCTTCRYNFNEWDDMDRRTYNYCTYRANKENYGRMEEITKYFKCPEKRFTLRVPDGWLGE